MRELAEAIEKKAPPASVKKALATCLKNASSIETALGKLTGPQAAYTKALGDRDALLPDWSKALRRLKKRAAVAWEDDEGTYKAVFAAVESIQAPKTKRRGKKEPGAAEA
jgi:hypothetical protein